MKKGFYRAFEEKHRGSRELIKNRIKIYLPFALPLKETYPSGLALDIGCGRGEWLELLKDNDIFAKGIDIDEGMLKACHERNFDVMQGDGIAYLKKQPKESVVIISAFHVVEHIPFDALQTFVSEALRTLKPGGLLIMETPNPENIRVATENFYLDPTHIKPIPSALLSFLPEFYGYERTKILRLQEDKELASQENINLLNVLGGVSPDYAVIAQKKANEEVLEQFNDLFAQDIGLPLATLSDKFEDRLQKIEAKAEQAGERTKQLDTELHSLYASSSWRITAPLRWFMFQLKLLRQHGFFSRITMVTKRIIRSVFKGVISFVNSRPRLLSIFVRITNKLGIYEPLRAIYFRFSKRPYSSNSEQKADIAPSSIKHLTPQARNIYKKLKLAIKEHHKGNS